MPVFLWLFERRICMTSISTTYRNSTISCNLAMADRWTANLRYPSELLSESVAYAALRAIRKDKTLREQLVSISYRLRFAKGKQTRSRRVTAVVSGALFDAPDATATLFLMINANGVYIERVNLLPSLKKTGARKKTGIKNLK